MIYYCNCKSKRQVKGRIKKDGSRGIWNLTDYRLYHKTIVDEDEICTNCGYYAVAETYESMGVSERVTPAKLNHGECIAKRNAEMGDAFISGYAAHFGGLK